MREERRKEMWLNRNPKGFAWYALEGSEGLEGFKRASLVLLVIVELNKSKPGPVTSQLLRPISI